ncbi:MAG: DUF6638 family protein [Litoreibacter sp.]
MRRLIDKGLMFGNLFHVNSASLAERYNRALKYLTGKTTTLTDFHIDISGYAPEVGEELGDHQYLNPNGCNRQFILISTEQKRAPLLETKFSTSRGILKTFIGTNEGLLFALTARDAVAGELVNSVYSIGSASDLFDIRKIKIEADTPGGHLVEAKKLSQMIEDFRTRDGAWWDEVLIGDMIDIAKTTGDVTRKPIDLKRVEYEQTSFWTSHFGGLYGFRDVKYPAAISIGPKGKIGSLPVPDLMDLTDPNLIATFLNVNELVEPIVKAKDVNAAALLRQKLDFIIVDVAAEIGIDLTGLRRRDLRRIARRNTASLPEEFHGLTRLLRWAEGDGEWPRIRADDPAYFYSLRATAGPERDLVNQLLAELCPMDIRQLFICHKELFYASYREWPEQKKAFVADFLEREYQVDKAGAREALFGGDAPLEEAAEELNIIQRVGPWGSIGVGGGAG